jgi:hypothetical protein
VQRGERHEVRAIREIRLDGARSLQGEPCLADPARAGQRQQPHRFRAQPLGDRGELIPTADRPVRR